MNKRSKASMTALIITPLAAAFSLQALNQQTTPGQKRFRGGRGDALHRNSSTGRESGLQREPSGEYASDHILIKFHPMATTQDINSLVRASGSRPSRMIPVVGLYRVDVPRIYPVIVTDMPRIIIIVRYAVIRGNLILCPNCKRCFTGKIRLAG